MSETDLLKEISKKLSDLIILTKLTSSKAIAEFKDEIAKDSVFQEILNCADGSLSSAQLRQKVTEKTQVSDVTVRRRISQLLEKGGLTFTKKGNETYYENSGLYE